MLVKNIKQSQTYVFEESAKFVIINFQMYSSLIFSVTVDQQILPTMHHDSEFRLLIITFAR